MTAQARTQKSGKSNKQQKRKSSQGTGSSKSEPKKPKEEHRPDLKNEYSVGFPKSIVAGVDEVGRGCIAGPVVAAAVILPEEAADKMPDWMSAVTDSKLMAPEDREWLYPLIFEYAHDARVAVASVTEIDAINIFHASHLAMIRSIGMLELKPDHLLIDGKFLPKNLDAPATAIIKGDMKSVSIACASIIAKVWRDRFMGMLDVIFPEYGFAKHKGYPTPAHLKALQTAGLTPYHRRSFEPVAALMK